MCISGEIQGQKVFLDAVYCRRHHLPTFCIVPLGGRPPEKAFVLMAFAALKEEVTLLWPLPTNQPFLNPKVCVRIVNPS